MHPKEDSSTSLWALHVYSDSSPHVGWLQKQDIFEICSVMNSLRYHTEIVQYFKTFWFLIKILTELDNDTCIYGTPFYIVFIDTSQCLLNRNSTANVIFVYWFFIMSFNTNLVVWKHDINSI